eukprot:4413858-Amphidinium_carterae.1
MLGTGGSQRKTGGSDHALLKRGFHRQLVSLLSTHAPQHYLELALGLYSMKCLAQAISMLTHVSTTILEPNGALYEAKKQKKLDASVKNRTLMKAALWLMHHPTSDRVPHFSMLFSWCLGGSSSKTGMYTGDLKNECVHVQDGTVTVRKAFGLRV